MLRVDACDKLTFEGLFVFSFSVSLAFSQSRCWSCSCVSVFSSTPGSFVHCVEFGCECDPELVMEYPGSFVVLI